MFIAILLKIVKNWKNPRKPLIEEHTNSGIFVQHSITTSNYYQLLVTTSTVILQYYYNLKRKKSLTHATMEINPKNPMLTEESYTKEYIIHDSIYTKF